MAVSWWLLSADGRNGAGVHVRRFVALVTNPAAAAGDYRFVYVKRKNEDAVGVAAPALPR